MDRQEYQASSSIERESESRKGRYWYWYWKEDITWLKSEWKGDILVSMGSPEIQRPTSSSILHQRIKSISVIPFTSSWLPNQIISLIVMFGFLCRYPDDLRNIEQHVLVYIHRWRVRGGLQLLNPLADFYSLVWMEMLISFSEKQISVVSQLMLSGTVWNRKYTTNNKKKNLT